MKTEHKNPNSETASVESPRASHSEQTGLNALEVYRDAGRKAGKAQRRRDYRLRSFYCNWLNRALALESQPYRDIAHAAFDQAYCIETGVIKFTPSVAVRTSQSDTLSTSTEKQ